MIEQRRSGVDEGECKWFRGGKIKNVGRTSIGTCKTVGSGYTKNGALRGIRKKRKGDEVV